MSVVHYTITERRGTRITACSRSNPTYSTVSMGQVNCLPCQRRIDKWQRTPLLDRAAMLQDWVDRAQVG